MAVRHLEASQVEYQSLSDSSEQVEIYRAVGQDVSSTIGCGLLRLKSGSLEWTLPYDEVVYVVAGDLNLRLMEGDEIHAGAGDIIWIPKGVHLKYEGACEIFYVMYPVNWQSAEASS